EALLRNLQVGEDQLVVEVAQIAEGIGIRLESPEHEAERVDLAQRLQGFRLELHSLAPRSGQVGEQHLGGRLLALLEHRAEPVETCIRNLDGAEVQLGFRPSFEAGERIEESSLARPRKSRETSAHGGPRRDDGTMLPNKPIT